LEAVATLTLGGRAGLSLKMIKKDEQEETWKEICTSGGEDLPREYLSCNE